MGKAASHEKVTMGSGILDSGIGSKPHETDSTGVVKVFDFTLQKKGIE